MSQATSWQLELIDDTEQDVYQWLTDQPEASADEYAEYIGEHLDNLALMCEEEELTDALSQFRAQIKAEPSCVLKSELLAQRFRQLKQTIPSDDIVIEGAISVEDFLSEDFSQEDILGEISVEEDVFDEESLPDVAVEPVTVSQESVPSTEKIEVSDLPEAKEADFQETDSAQGMSANPQAGEDADKFQEGVFAEEDPGDDSMPDVFAELGLAEEALPDGFAESGFTEDELADGFAESGFTEDELPDGFAESGFTEDELPDGFAESGFTEDELADGFAESGFTEDELADGFAESGFTEDELPDGFAESDFTEDTLAEAYADSELTDAGLTALYEEEGVELDATVGGLPITNEEIKLLVADWQVMLKTEDWIAGVQPILIRLETWAQKNQAKGLVHMIKWLIHNLVSLRKDALPERRQYVSVVGEKLFWLASNLDDHNCCFELLEIAEAAFWPCPLSEEESLAVFGLFVPSEELPGDEGHEWSEADVSMVLADDVSPQVLECFLQDSPQQLEELSNEVAQLLANFDTEVVHAAQRISHTIKGAANLVGAKAIANIAHQMEALLELAATEKTPLSNAQLNWLQVSVDCLAGCMDSLIDHSEPPAAALLLRQLYPPSREDDSSPALPVAVVPAAEKPVATVTAMETTQQQERIAVEKKEYDQLLSFAEEMSITLVQTRDLQSRLRNLLVDSLRQDDQLQARRFDLESLVDSRSQAGGLSKPLVGAHSDMDPLEMDRYDELHSSTHRFIETVMDSRSYTRQLNEEFIQLESLIQQQQRHNVGLQNCLLGARQVPVSYISQRLQRCVRETCRATGKQALLNIEGENLRVDKELLDALAWALMHLLRNAVDHGIESPEQRSTVGKSAQGLITLEFVTDGLKLMVRCHDDGGGLDLARIQSKAIERGIVGGDTQMLNHEQIENIVFQSGFSTRDAASQISGRGIGLDAVRDRLASLGGEIHLQRNQVPRCEFYLELPLKRLTQHLLLVRSGERRFALPSNVIKQTLPSQVADLRTVAGKPFLEWENVLYPYYSLESVLEGGATRMATKLNPMPVLLVKMQQGLAAVAVDQLLGAQALVRRPLGEYVGNIKGVDGITLMGDGTPVALLEPRSLLAKASPRLGNLSQPAAVSATGKATSILVVDDSLSVRNALSELLADMGFEVSTANDGMDAVEKVQQHCPDLVLVDMEMPRMNGLDFTRWVRKESAEPNLPVVMLTSRTQGKHRKMAEDAGVSHYQTKPYSDVELLDCINGLLLREVS